MYLPTQFAEICIRNAINHSLKTRYGSEWFQRGQLLCILPNRLKDELNKVICDEKIYPGAPFSTDRVVAGLSFGFWVHLFTKHFDHILWKDGLKTSFPYIPSNIYPSDLHKRANQVRVFRNRIAHYNAIFDRNPTQQFQNMLDLISWVCPDTLWFMRQLTNPALIIGQRPKL